LQKKYYEIGLLALIVIAAFWALISVMGNRPLIMGDELIFFDSVLVKELSVSNAAGYGYDVVFSVAQMCGDSYYSCVKLGNWGFLIATAALIFFAATKLGISRIYSMLLVLAFLISPQAVRVSFFMPDVMFYFISTLSVILVYLYLQNPSRSLQVASIVSLAISMLTKPHGVFLAIGLAIVVALFVKGSVLKRGIEAGILLAGSIVLRMVAGFLAAGSSGFSLFGGYTGESGAIEAVGGNISEGIESGVLFERAVTFAGLALLSFLVGAVVLLPGLSGALIQKPTESTDAKISDWNPQNFLYFVLLLFGSQAAAFAFFIFYAALGGESFENRVVFRYVEFLIPLMVLAIVGAYSRQAKFEISPKSFVFLGLSVVAVVAGVITFGDGVNQRFADSAYTFLFSRSDLMGLAYILIGILALLQFLGVARVVQRVSILAYVILIPALGLLTNLTLQSTTAQLAVLDDGAEALAQHYKDDPSEEVYVIAGSKGEAQYLQMVSGLPDSEYLVATAPGRGELPFETDDAWVLSVGPNEFNEVGNGYKVSGQNYSLERIDGRNIHFFGQKMLGSPVAQVEGFANVNSRFIWMASPEATITLEQDLSDFRQIEIEAMAAEGFANDEYFITFGEEEYRVTAPSVAGSLTSFSLDLAGASGNEIIFSSIDGSENFGLGLFSIELR
jgi:hypothetical protein